MKFLLVEFPQHVVSKVIGQGELFDNLFDFLQKLLFTEISLCRSGVFLLGAVIVVMSLLLLTGDGTTAIGAGKPASEWEIIFAAFARLAPVFHHLLHRVEQLSRDEWLELSLVIFAIGTHDSVVDWILKHGLDTGFAHGFSCTTAKTLRFQKVLDGVEGVFASAIEFKGFTNNGCFLWIKVNIPCVRVIEIPRRSKP